MIDKCKGLVAGLLLGTMITGGTIYASNTKSIEVAFDKIRFMVDGVEKRPSSGQPFVYGGTTYVPLRFAAEATGKDIQYDSRNKTIWIGAKEGSFTYLSDMEYARAEGVARNTIGGMYQQFFIDHWDVSWSHESGPLTIAGKEYSHGFGVDLGRVYTDETGTVYYNLDGKFSKLTGFVGIDDSTKNSTSNGYVTIYGDDTQIYKSEELAGGDYAIPVDLNVKGIAKLKIVFSLSSRDNVTRAVAVDFVEAKLVQ